MTNTTVTACNAEASEMSEYGGAYDVDITLTIDGERELHGVVTLDAKKQGIGDSINCWISPEVCNYLYTLSESERRDLIDDIHSAAHAAC